LVLLITLINYQIIMKISMVKFKYSRGNFNNKKGPGIVITKIKSSGLFCKYNFQVKDVLLFINDVPCNNHIHVMKQIMNLFQSCKPLKIIKL